MSQYEYEEIGKVYRPVKKPTDWSGVIGCIIAAIILGAIFG